MTFKTTRCGWRYVRGTVTLSVIAILLAMAACVRSTQTTGPATGPLARPTNANGRPGPQAAPTTGNPTTQQQVEAYARAVEQSLQSKRKAGPTAEIEWVNQPPTQPEPQPAQRAVSPPAMRTTQADRIQSKSPAARQVSFSGDPAPAEPAEKPRRAVVSDDTPAPADRSASKVSLNSADPRRLSNSQLVSELVRRLDEQSDGPTESLKPFVLRSALSLADPKLEVTGEDVAHLPRPQRRLLLAYQRTFTQLGQELGQDLIHEDDVLETAAIELHEQVAGWQTLNIRTAKLCTRVKGYGVYEEFDRYAFLAGRVQPAIIYVELDHFDTEAQSNGKFAVRLTSEVVLYNETDGLPVWRQSPVAIVDESANRRRDFFVVQIIKLPDRLTVGKYRLKVTITDEVGREVDEATIPLQIVADAALATGQK